LSVARRIWSDFTSLAYSLDDSYVFFRSFMVCTFIVAEIGSNSSIVKRNETTPAVNRRSPVRFSPMRSPWLSDKQDFWFKHLRVS
jgi:hypothetical protein